MEAAARSGKNRTTSNSRHKKATESIIKMLDAENGNEVQAARQMSENGKYHSNMITSHQTFCGNENLAMSSEPESDRLNALCFHYKTFYVL
jgi:hypothetical protein